VRQNHRIIRADACDPALDGKMQDDATWKQAKVMVDLARSVAAKDPDGAARYGF
jgi:citrate lyase beta subunit